MKALVKYAEGKNNMEIRDVPEPFPGENEVKIEVKATGICGSDIHIYEYDIGIPMKLPVVTGHEFSGVIVEKGKNVSGFAIEDKVTAETTFRTCGICRHCLLGNYNLCLKREGIGYWHNGAFTKYIIIPSEKVHILPEPISFKEGAMIEPLACVVNGTMEVINIKASDRVLVIGPGTIGLLALQVARANGGLVTVAGVSKDEERLKIAKKLGADYILNVDQDKVGLKKEIARITNNEMFDVVLECSGAEPAANFGLEVIRRRGKYSQIGLFGRPIKIDFEKISYKELTVKGSFSQKWNCWDRAIRLIESNKVQLKPLISDVFPLNNWKIAFDKFRNKEGLKILLTPFE